VRKGEVGRPPPLTRLHLGFAARGELHVEGARRCCTRAPSMRRFSRVERRPGRRNKHLAQRDIWPRRWCKVARSPDPFHRRPSRSESRGQAREPCPFPRQETAAPRHRRTRVLRDRPSPHAQRRGPDSRHADRWRIVAAAHPTRRMAGCLVRRATTAPARMSSARHRSMMRQTRLPSQDQASPSCKGAGSASPAVRADRGTRWPPSLRSEECCCSCCLEMSSARVMAAPN